MDTFLNAIGASVLFLIVLVVIGLLMGYPMMWLMNYLFTPSLLQLIFGISAMTFWKAFWFNIFMGMAFKSKFTKHKED